MFWKFRFVIFTATLILGIKLKGVNSQYRNMDLKVEEDMDVSKGDTAHVPLDERKGMEDISKRNPDYESTPPRKEDAASSDNSQLAVGESSINNQVKEDNQPKHQPSAPEDNQVLYDQPVLSENIILHMQEEQSTPFSAKDKSDCNNREHKESPLTEVCEDPEATNHHSDRSSASSVGSKHHLVEELTSEPEVPWKTSRQSFNNGIETERVQVHANTLKGFGYHFNEAGELRSIEGDEPFKFVIKEDDHEYNQRHYEALGEAVTEYVYNLLIEKAGLVKTTIPVDVEDDEARGFFFMSPSALEKETILLIIHGSGVVRAGQWTRKLIINNDLDKGTQLPYIDFGKKQDYGVVVLNTNQNVDDKERLIRVSESPEAHALYVWDKFIEYSAVKHVAVVAHSYGGIVTSTLSDKRQTFRERVFAIAFTDSVHGFGLSEKTRQLFAKCAVNWVSSDKPLDTELNDYGDSKRCSAGHHLHEWTSHSARESVFKFIVEKHKKILDETEQIKD